jgi:cytochrome c
MGPAFKDISAKYKGKADAEAKLVTEISTGKGHPAVKASPDDVKSLVKWVLSL